MVKIIKLNLCRLTLIFLTLPVSASYAATISTTVPFETITLNPNDVIQAGYAFGLHAMVFCFDNNLETIANIQWTYKGIAFNAPLPQSLKTNPQFEGAYADSNGIVTITNTANKALIISCQFGF